MSGFLQFVAPLVHPLGLGWLMLLAAAAFCARKRRPAETAVCTTAFVLVWLVGQPRVSHPLIRDLERPWLEATVDRAPRASAVVVLGGGWRPSRPDFASLDLTACADRLVTGFELCRLGRAPALVLGGDPPEPPPGMRPSSERIREWLELWKIAPVACHTLGPVRSTREEAERTRDLVRREGWTNILLVTSAFHMRRSVDAFEKAGVPVHPVACDFQALRVSETSPGWSAFPNPEACAAFGLWWHERLGWLAYRLFGHL